MQARIDFERLRQDVETLATIGRHADLGLYRMAFSDGDWAAREWLAARIQAAELDLHVDGAANIHARL
jgi:N-carbamoyl-L-amino-acid hydrolase